MSFDPSIDDVSCGLHRSSRSSLAGTSATSAADISTLSVNVSQRQLSNSLGENEDGGGGVMRTSSRASAVSMEREDGEDQLTPTTLTEFAVVHQQQGSEDAHFVLPAPFPTPTPSTMPSPLTPSYSASGMLASPEKTPTASSMMLAYPAPPPLFSNSFHSDENEGSPKVRTRLHYVGFLVDRNGKEDYSSGIDPCSY